MYGPYKVFFIFSLPISQFLTYLAVVLTPTNYYFLFCTIYQIVRWLKTGLGTRLTNPNVIYIYIFLYYFSLEILWIYKTVELIHYIGLGTIFQLNVIYTSVVFRLCTILVSYYDVYYYDVYCVQHQVTSSPKRRQISF